MQVGMIGLGRMGANMVRRLMRGGHDCVVYDVSADAVAALEGEGARAPARSRSSSRAGAAALDLHHGPGRRSSTRRSTTSPRCCRPTTPSSTAATPTTATTSPRRGARREGPPLRRHGHERRRVRPRARLLPDDRRRRQRRRAPRPVLQHARPRRRRRAAHARPRGRPAPAEHGYLHCGPAGAGHFVKMVHNGIEYGMMAAYAEGLNIIKHADIGAEQQEHDAETTPLREPELYQYDFDRRDHRGLAARQRGRLVAARPDRGGARPGPGARELLRPRVGLRRGPLDRARRHRRGRSRAGAHRRLFARFASRGEDEFANSVSRRCGSRSAGTWRRAPRVSRRAVVGMSVAT